MVLRGLRIVRRQPSSQRPNVHLKEKHHYEEHQLKQIKAGDKRYDAEDAAGLVWV